MYSTWGVLILGATGSILITSLIFLIGILWLRDGFTFLGIYKETIEKDIKTIENIINEKDAQAINRFAVSTIEEQNVSINSES